MFATRGVQTPADEDKTTVNNKLPIEVHAERKELQKESPSLTDNIIGREMDFPRDALQPIEIKKNALDKIETLPPIPTDWSIACLYHTKSNGYILGLSTVVVCSNKEQVEEMINLEKKDILKIDKWCCINNIYTIKITSLPITKEEKKPEFFASKANLHAKIADDMAYVWVNVFLDHISEIFPSLFRNKLPNLYLKHKRLISAEPLLEQWLFRELRFRLETDSLTEKMITDFKINLNSLIIEELTKHPNTVLELSIRSGNILQQAWEKAAPNLPQLYCIFPYGFSTTYNPKFSCAQFYEDIDKESFRNVSQAAFSR